MNAKVIVGAIVLLVAVVVGGYFYNLQQEAAKWQNVKEIEEATFTRSDNTTTARFVGVVEGPIDKVQEALWDVENGAGTIENIQLSKLISQEGNTKVVEMHLKALNLPLQHFKMEFVLHPADHRVSFKTVESQLQHLEGDYQLESSPDGKRTRIVYSFTGKDKVAIPFPSSVLESANKETFVHTVRGLSKRVKGSAAG
jgi:hypothetical protein